MGGVLDIASAVDGAIAAEQCGPDRKLRIRRICSLPGFERCCNKFGSVMLIPFMRSRSGFQGHRAAGRAKRYASGAVRARATSIIWLKLVWRSSAGSPSPVSGLSEIVSRHSAFLPARAAFM